MEEITFTELYFLLEVNMVNSTFEFRQLSVILWCLVERILGLLKNPFENHSFYQNRKQAEEKGGKEETFPSYGCDG